MSALWAAGGERTGDQKKSTSLFFLLFYCTCLLSNQSTESNCLRKKKGFTAVGIAVWPQIYTVVGCLFQSDKSKLIAAGPKCDVLFFLGILKWRWCLIHFWFISTLLTETGNLLQWNMELSAKAAKNLDTTIRWKRNVVRFWAVVLFQLCDYSLFQLNNAPVTKAGPIKNNNKKTLA